MKLDQIMRIKSFQAEEMNKMTDLVNALKDKLTIAEENARKGSSDQTTLALKSMTSRASAGDHGRIPSVDVMEIKDTAEEIVMKPGFDVSLPTTVNYTLVMIFIGAIT